MAVNQGNCDSFRVNLTDRFSEAINDLQHPLSLALAHAAVEAIELHAKKGKDYGKDTDPFANIRSATEFGVPAHVGCMIRANDKMSRIKAHATTGVLANEGLEDSLIDLAVYSLIALVLRREEAAAGITSTNE